MAMPFTTKCFPPDNALTEMDKYREKAREAMTGVSDYYSNPYMQGMQQYNNGWSQQQIDEKMRLEQERMMRNQMNAMKIGVSAKPKPEGSQMVEDYHKKRRGLLILLEGL